jgi:DNA-binding MarR family transcriptional regulator
VQLRSDPAEKRQIEEFRRDLRVLERAMVRQLAQDTECCGVTLAQCHALLELSAAPLSLTALAAALDLDISTLSRTVDGLVRCGFVERTEDAADRRAVRLELTDSGRRKVATIDEMCNQYYGALFGGLAEKDQRCVVRAVRLLADIMRRQRAPEAATCGQPGSQTKRRSKRNE